MSEAFLIWPDRRLRAKAAPVAQVGAAERALWARMEAAMYAMPGVGLAAPQIGEPVRLAVVDCEPHRRAPIRLANPEILEVAEAMETREEASPNLPGIGAMVKRPAAVRVRYLDAEGAPTERWFREFWATSVQHQIDHLEGWLFPDRLGPVKRRMLLERYAKLRRRG
ncbi:MAG: peptide deformylase [Paracoccaceae bacterium]